MSNSQLKEIAFTPILTNMKNNSGPKNRTLKRSSSSHIKPNKLKTQLLTKIKNYRQNGNKIDSNTDMHRTSHNHNNHNNYTINDTGNDINKQSSSMNSLDTPKISIIKNANNNDNDNHNISYKGFLKDKKQIKNNKVSSKINDISLEEDDDFSQSINFLKSLSSKNKKKTLKSSDNFPIHLGNPDMNVESTKSGEPSYGCLKNGSLPTYREWKNKTLKNTNQYNENNQPNLTTTLERNQETNLTTTLERNQEPNLTTTLERNQEPNLEDTIEKSGSIIFNPKKTTTLKYHLGKRGKKVAILIKNSATRKKVRDEHLLLKQTKLTDMKNYLKRHNLLKSGSHAPPEIIKKLYEQSLLGGDIRNSNKNNIIHNYLS